MGHGAGQVRGRTGRLLPFSIQDDRLQPGQGLAVRLRQQAQEVDLAKAGPHHHNFRPGTADDVGNLGGAETGIDGRRNGPQTATAQAQRYIGGAIRQPQSHPVPGADAKIRQHGGGPAAQIVDLGEGDGLVMIDDRGIRSVGGDQIIHERGDGIHTLQLLPAKSRP